MKKRSIKQLQYIFAEGKHACQHMTTADNPYNSDTDLDAFMSWENGYLDAQLEEAQASVYENLNKHNFKEYESVSQ